MVRVPVLLITLAVAAQAVAGCLGDGDGAALAVDGEDNGPLAATGPGLGTFLRNVSQPLEGVSVLTSIVENLKVPAADGVMLDSWIVRPDVDGPVPIVLEVTPYYAGGSPVDTVGGTHRIGNIGSTLVEHGYAFGKVSVRGTGYSGGCFTQGGPTEAKDTAAVVEALAAEPWSNGNVGIIGVSYPGTTPQDVWVEAPSSLKTIVPISGISDMYKYNFVNGVPIDIQGFGFNTYYWATVGATPVFTDVANGQPLSDPVGVATSGAGEACVDQAFVQEGGVSSTVDGNKDAYWLVRDFRLELLQGWDKPRASVFYIHGLQDWNVKPHMMEDWLDAIQDSGVPYKVWIGQWTHNWPQRDDWWNTTLVAWFDEFLKGQDTGILDAPPVQVQDDDGVWRHEENWPPRDVDWVTLYPQADGSLGAQEAGTGSASYHDHLGGVAPGEADFGPAQVVWTSEPLTHDATISGLPVFKGEVTASGRQASLMLTLAEILPDGTQRPFNFAALSLNHADDLTQGRTDISDVTQQVKVRFFPQDDIVHAGSRIALIAAGNLVGGPGPPLQPVSDGSTITIGLENSRLILPMDMSRVVEDPQPCWDEDSGEPDECYIYPARS